MLYPEYKQNDWNDFPWAERFIDECRIEQENWIEEQYHMHDSDRYEQMVQEYNELAAYYD